MTHNVNLSTCKSGSIQSVSNLILYIRWYNYKNYNSPWNITHQSLYTALKYINLFTKFWEDNLIWIRYFLAHDSHVTKLQACIYRSTRSSTNFVINLQMTMSCCPWQRNKAFYVVISVTSQAYVGHAQYTKRTRTT